jgi:O-antigen/teichoic acid export membrane protein
MNKYKKIKIFSDFFGYDRNTRLKKNILASLFIKGTNFILELVLVTMLLAYLGILKFGIIIIMLSLVTWFTFLDFGLGHGLRNKFAGMLSVNKHKQARTYVSTCYLMLGIISIIFFSFFLFINQFLPWHKILAVDQSFNEEILILSLIIFGYLSLVFVLEIISHILWADQKSSIADLILLINKILIIVVIYIFSKTSSASLIYVGLTYSVIPLLILSIFSIYLYNSMYKNYSPSFKFVDFKYGKKLYKIGWKFFILQISYIILMLTDSMIITQLYGPESVPPYYIAGKYYGVALIFFQIVISPTRSAFTEAYTRKNFSWIKNTMKKQKKILIGVTLFVVIMIFSSNFAFKIWVGEKIIIDYRLSIGWGLFVVISSYSATYTYFLNGVGKIKLQVINASIAAIINIPLSIFLAKYVGLGSAGVIIATSVTLLIYLIFGKIQYEKIINNKATGIWNE